MRAAAIRGLIERDNAGKYVLTVSGREVFAAILAYAGFERVKSGPK